MGMHQPEIASQAPPSSQLEELSGTSRPRLGRYGAALALTTTAVVLVGCTSSSQTPNHHPTIGNYHNYIREDINRAPWHDTGVGNSGTLKLPEELQGDLTVACKGPGNISASIYDKDGQRIAGIQFECGDGAEQHVGMAGPGDTVRVQTMPDTKKNNIEWGVAVVTGGDL